MNNVKILIVVSNFYLINGYNNYFHRNIIPTRGKIWPKPNFEERYQYKFIDPNNFHFMLIGYTCDILDHAIIRYTKIIKESSKIRNYTIDRKLDLVTTILVYLQEPCEQFPHLEMDESYSISEIQLITSNSIWGILRGLETYSQLIVSTTNGMLEVASISLKDSPRFPHRGLMLDTARHYVKVELILKILDGMAYNKLNVFHWHIVDDQSFPYQSIKYPELSEKGAYMPSMIYTQENIINIIEYARMRGIRVVPEFDVPAHTRSWGNSHPELLTICEWYLQGELGPLNPISESTFIFLQNFFSEVINVFPDQFLHIGGNDISFECWNSNKDIANYISANNILSENLYINFMKNISMFLAEKSVTAIVWQEATRTNNKLPKRTIVQVQLNNWQSHLDRLTKLGYRVVLSECWFLNKFTGYDYNNWINYYTCDPRVFDGNEEQKKLVIGGEAIIWSNIVGNHNVLQKIFPKICAIAERLWSKEENIRNITDAAQRFEEHVCRMVLRGLSIESLSKMTIC